MIVINFQFQKKIQGDFVSQFDNWYMITKMEFEIINGWINCEKILLNPCRDWIIYRKT